MYMNKTVNSIVRLQEKKGLQTKARIQQKHQPKVREATIVP